MSKTTKLIMAVGACALTIVGITLAIPFIKENGSIETTKTEN